MSEIEQEAVDTSDIEWATERVTRMCANAYADAAVYRKKLLKGFGYPNETFARAQDARALSILLARLREVQEERDVARREPSEVLAWLNAEQKSAARWVRFDSGVNRFTLTGPELMRIRRALEGSRT